MPDPTASPDPLALAADFPPVSTEDWEAAIAKDLKGASYEKKLVFDTQEGVRVRPYYRRADLETLSPDLASLAPGEFPHTRGPAHDWQQAQAFTPPANAIRADLLHESGATAVQQLAFALAQAVERLAATVDAAPPAEISFVYAAGPNYFLEIAKLRAARQLWATAVDAFQPADPKAALARIHVRTPQLNKTVLDPYTNLLRVTTEAMSAVIGGCDSLDVEPYGFDPHLAANVHHILREEAHLAEVLDPAGGSYYIENLTASLAAESWKAFQQIEAAGGWTAAKNAGLIDAELKNSREARTKAIASRRQTLVGVNNYPNPADADPPAAPAPSGDRAAIRLAAPLEAIRNRTNQHAQQTGRRPSILLLKHGDLKMKMARANFCLNFFGCAGFEILESDQLPQTTTGAALVVLCSSDPEYLALAREVCPRLNVPVLIAGNPKDQIEQLRAAGIQGFVHIQSNIVDTLHEWQNHLGLPPLQEPAQ